MDELTFEERRERAITRWLGDRKLEELNPTERRKFKEFVRYWRNPEKHDKMLNKDRNQRKMDRKNVAEIKTRVTNFNIFAFTPS